MEKNKNLFIYNVKQLVTPLGKKGVSGAPMNQLHVIEDAAIIISDGIIREIGTTQALKERVKTYGDIELIDANNHIALPGFVDSHTHFVFSGERSEEYSWRLQGESYMDIHKKGGGILNTVRSTRDSSYEQLLECGIERLNAAMAQGITSMEGKSGYGLDWPTELKQLNIMNQLNAIHPITVIPTYMAAHSMPPDYTGTKDDYIQELIEKQLPIVASEKLAHFCDVFCEEGVFSVEQSRRLLQSAQNLGMDIKLHADEVVDTGAAGLAAELNARSADHLLMASKSNLEKMQKANVIATLLPVTAFSLGEPYPDVNYMQQMNMTIALGTDFNPGSSYSHNIPFLIALATRHMGMSIESVITALTLNGAAALGLSEEIGSIEIGKRADLVLHDCPNYKHLAYHMAHNHVSKVIKDGFVIYSIESALHNHKKNELDPIGTVVDSEESKSFSSYEISEFLEETASSNPVPGGGSIAAQSGATAASLVEMVANLTLNRKKYSEVQKDMEEVIVKIRPIRQRLLELIDEDAISYHHVMKAYGLPKETDEQKNKRNVAILESLKDAAATPYEVAQLSQQVLNLAEIVVQKGNSNAITDGIVAAMTARTAILSALYNVKINLGSIVDEVFVKAYEAKIVHMVTVIEAQELSIRKSMNLL